MDLTQDQVDYIVKFADEHPQFTHVVVLSDNNGGINMHWVKSFDRAEEVHAGRESAEIFTISHEEE